MLWNGRTASGRCASERSSKKEYSTARKEGRIDGVRHDRIRGDEGT